MAYEDIPMEDEFMGDGGQPQSPEPQGNPPEPGQPVQPVQPVQPATGPAWDGNQFALKYRGQPYVTKSKDELINLANRGFSYSQEMERMKRDRLAWQQERDGLQSRYSQYDEFDQMLKNNPAFAEEMIALADKHRTGGQSQSQGEGGNYQMYNKLVNRINELERMNTDRMSMEEDRVLAENLKRLRSTYPDHDWDYDDGTGSLEKKLLQFAMDNKIYNVEHAYRVMMWDQYGTNAKTNALKNASRQKQSAFRAGVVNQGVPSGGSPKNQSYKYGDTYNDLAKRMEAELTST